MSEGKDTKEKPKKPEWKPDDSVTMKIQKDESGWKSDKDIQMEIRETFQKKEKEKEK